MIEDNLSPSVANKGYADLFEDRDLDGTYTCLYRKKGGKFWQCGYRFEDSFKTTNFDNARDFFRNYMPMLSKGDIKHAWECFKIAKSRVGDTSAHFWKLFEPSE